MSLKGTVEANDWATLNSISMKNSVIQALMQISNVEGTHLSWVCLDFKYIYIYIRYHAYGVKKKKNSYFKRLKE